MHRAAALWLAVRSAGKGAGPRGHLLSNGAYTVLITNAGSGYSACRGLALTRWREDRTSDGWGQFCYLRDLRSGALWSSAYQPTRVEPDDYEVVFGPDRAVIRRRDGTLDTHTEIAVSPEDDVEIRRVSITNRGTGVREIELTSYAEVVLGPQNADLAHPAFGNLFVETTLLPERDATRRDSPRVLSCGEKHPRTILLSTHFSLPMADAPSPPVTGR